MQKFDREQLVLMVEVVFNGALTMICDMLPPAVPLNEMTDPLEKIVLRIEGIVCSIGSTLPSLFASITNEGMGTCEFSQFNQFSMVIDGIVKKRTDPNWVGLVNSPYYPPCRGMAEEFVDQHFKDYLEDLEPMDLTEDEDLIDEIGDEGIVLADGTSMSFRNLARILKEISNPKLLEPYVRSKDGAFKAHVESSLKETARLLACFPQLAEVKFNRLTPVENTDEHDKAMLWRLAQNRQTGKLAHMSLSLSERLPFFTDPTSAGFDAELTRQLREMVPHWFDQK